MGTAGWEWVRWERPGENGPAKTGVPGPAVLE